MDTTVEGFKGVEYCDKLFKIEIEIALLSIQEKLEVRQSKSKIESVKANKLNVYKYIKYLLDNLPQIENINDEENLSKYLPW